MLLALTSSSVVNALIYLVVASLIFYLIWWFVNWVGVPEPFRKVIQVVLVLFALLLLIDFLAGLMGHGFLGWY